MTQKQRSDSEKRARAKFKKKYLPNNPHCVVRWDDDCEQRATTVHEPLKFSSGGKREEGNAVATCNHCHERIHSNPAKSIELGWLLNSWDTIPRLDRRRQS